MSLDDVAELGISIRPHDGPRIRFTWKWLWPPFVAVVGTWGLQLRAEGRGRSLGWELPLLVYSAIGLFIAVLLVRQLWRVRRAAGADRVLLGWACGGVGEIPSLHTTGWRGWRGGFGTPIVAVYLADASLEVLVDGAGIGFVREKDELRVSLGVRGPLRWLILEEGERMVTLRLFGHRLC